MSQNNPHETLSMRIQLSTSWKRWFAAAGLALVLSLLPLPGRESLTQGKSPLERVEAAWKARQARFSTVALKWTAREWFARGGVSESLPPIYLKESKLSIQPPQDTAFTVPYHLTLDANQVRAGYRGWQWYMTEGRYNATRWVAAYDGKLSRECYLEREGEQRWPRGSVIQKGAFAGARYGFLRPPFVFFRALEREHAGFDLGSFTCTGAKVKVRGVTCLELQQRYLTGTLHLWVDEARDHVVVRQQSLSNGVPSLQIDYDYKEDGRWGWLLSGWELSSMGRGGRITETSKVQVTETKLNQQLEDQRVGELIFPPGSLIMDNVDRTQYIVRDDGSNRMLSVKELGIPYDALVALARNEQRSQWLTYLLISAAVVCLGLFVYRQFRRRPITSS